ncbi:MAG: enoyl-CoA hydratase-related protein [Burkholderiales bacterium]|nr:enoyl-CoA hydratase-related protein [Burkholderiales bacterium]
MRIGLSPATISPYVVRAIGERAARRYFHTGERFGAEEALRLGLLHRVCAPEALDAAVEKTLGELLAGGPQAHRAIKDLIRTVARGGPVSDALSEETARRIAEIRVSPEGREGIASFLEKRKPAWLAPKGPGVP